MEKKMNFICPSCGTELEISIKNTSKKAVERIQALKDAGFDTNSLFAIEGVSGKDYLGFDTGGKMMIVDTVNPILQKIRCNGDVPNNKLFRRWVMAQTFRILMRSETKNNGNVTATIQELGWNYQWKMLENEFYAQYKMCKHGDTINYINRRRWFNKQLVLRMLQDYSNDLSRNFMMSSDCHKSTKRIGNGYHSLDEVKEVKRITLEIIDTISGCDNGDQARVIYNQLVKFNREKIDFDRNTKQHYHWVNAYKGAGAFFTLQNMIRFHGCVLHDEMSNKLSTEMSLIYLSTKAEEYKNDGWKLYGLMREVLRYNNVDIVSKMLSWRKR